MSLELIMTCFQVLLSIHHDNNPWSISTNVFHRWQN